MTTPTATPWIQYDADGTVGPLEIPWPFYADTDLDVWAGSTLMTLTTDYTLTGAGESTGGELTWEDASKPDADTVVTIVRGTVPHRDSDFQTSGAVRARVLNEQFDFIIAALQDLLFQQGLTLRVSALEGSGLELPDVDTRANKHLAFDGTGAITMTSDAPVSDLKRTEPPLTLVDAQAAYALPSEVQSGLDEDNYRAWLVNGSILVPATDYTITADTLTLTTTPTTANGLAGQYLMVELVRPALNLTSVQPGTVNTAALADGAVTSDKLSFASSALGALLQHDGSDWIVLPAPTTDGKHLLGIDVSSSGTVKTFAYKNKALLNDLAFATFNSTPSHDRRNDNRQRRENDDHRGGRDPYEGGDDRQRHVDPPDHRQRRDGCGCRRNHAGRTVPRRHYGRAQGATRTIRRWRWLR